MTPKNCIPVWLDCDPGHDDAFAILLAAFSPKIHLLGISIVHGNDTVDNCALNALRINWACGVKGIRVYKGIETPITRKPKFCPEIHGISGEQGVAGMCGYHFPDEKIFSSGDYKIEETHAVIAMAEAIRAHKEKVTVVLTGAQTNFAFVLRMFPEIKENIEKVVFMGGAIGLGNNGQGAEFNILIDPEAAKVVFESGIHVVMIPLEVTHQVLARDEILAALANIDNETITLPAEGQCPLGQLPRGHVEYSEISESIRRRERMNQAANAGDNGAPEQECVEFSSPFAECFYNLLTFFRSSYCKEFGFVAPPLHDPCTIFFLTNPQHFRQIHLYVNVETGSEKCAGRTLCDINNLSKEPPNVSVCTDIDVNAFWQNLLWCAQQASKNSPMNI